MINYDIRVQWFGNRVKQQLRHRVNNGIVKATRFLFFKIKRKISVWGSIFITSIKRFRKTHSSPGQPPLKQTGNLEKSLDAKYRMGQDGYVQGGIISDAAYVETLEKGGTFQVDQSAKTHTRVRLVNPFKAARSIAPRPFIIPTIEENKDRLAKIISNG